MVFWQVIKRIRFKETADKMRDAIIGSHPNGALSFNSLVNLSGFNLLPMEQMKEVVDSWLAQGILVATSSRRNDLRVVAFQVNYNHDFWSDAITVNSSSESNDSVESDKEDEYDDDDDQDEGGDEIFDSLAEAQGDEGNVPVYVKRERVTEEDEKEEDSDYEEKEKPPADSCKEVSSKNKFQKSSSSSSSSSSSFFVDDHFKRGKGKGQD